MSFHATSRKNCWIAPCSIGPRQMTGVSSCVKNPMETIWRPYRSAGTIFLPSVSSCARRPTMIGHVRAVHVAVEQRDPAAPRRQRDGEIDRHGRLPHAAFARADRDDVLHTLDGRAAQFRARIGADARRHLDLHVPDARQRRDRGSRLITQQVLHGAGRRRELDHERHAFAFDRELLDEPERDDVLVQIGILDGFERVEDGSLGDSGH